MANASVTKHGEKRARNRLGIPKKSVEKYVSKAMECGLTHAESTGNLHKYLDKLYLSHDNYATAHIYHQYVYLFSGDRLVTVFILPNSLRKSAEKQFCRKNQVYTNKENLTDLLPVGV